MILNQNPQNYFNEVEQAAFSPSNIVPGIGFSPDKCYKLEFFSYPDAQRYRIGTNYHLLPVNRAKSEVNTYNVAGAMNLIVIKMMQLIMNQTAMITAQKKTKAILNLI